MVGFKPRYSLNEEKKEFLDERMQILNEHISPRPKSKEGFVVGVKWTKGMIDVAPHFQRQKLEDIAVIDPENTIVKNMGDYCFVSIEGIIYRVYYKNDLI